MNRHEKDKLKHEAKERPHKHDRRSERQNLEFDVTHGNAMRGPLGWFYDKPVGRGEMNMNRNEDL